MPKSFAATVLLLLAAAASDTRSEGQLADHPTNWKSLSDAQWRSRLTPEQYRVCRKGGTERAFSGTYHASKEPGTYVCVACGQELFGAAHKFDSGTGWPSYWQPISPNAVTEHQDRSFFMTRTEVQCSGCNSHLGHVFTDGPPPTGLRYCINSACLKLVPPPPESKKR